MAIYRNAHRGAQKSNSDDAAGQTGGGVTAIARAVGRVTAVAVVTSNGNRVHTPLIAGPPTLLKKKPPPSSLSFDVSADTRA